MFTETTKYIKLLILATVLAGTLNGQNRISGVFQACPNTVSTYTVVSQDYVGITYFNPDGTVSIEPVRREQDITITGGTIIEFTTTDGRVQTHNSSFLGRDQDIRPSIIGKCAIPLASPPITRSQLNLCIQSLSSVSRNTVASFKVRWDNSNNLTCNSKIGYSTRVIRKICVPVPGQPESCFESSVQDASVRVNQDYAICKGPQKAIDLAQSGDGCYGKTTTYRPILSTGAIQIPNATYQWTVNGQNRQTGSSNTFTVVNEYDNSGRMRIGVKVSACAVTTAEYVETFLPPIANTSFKGPGCVAPGAGTYVQTVGGQLKSVQQVKVNNVVTSSYYFNGRNEIDFYAPTSGASGSLNVQAIDQCGASRIIYFSFMVSNNCSSTPTCQYGQGCLHGFSDKDQASFIKASTEGMSEEEWINNKMPELLNRINRSAESIPSLSSTTSARLDEEIIVYPNPATNRVNISLNVRTVEVQVVNITGQIIRSVVVRGEDQSLPLDISDLHTGAYVVKRINEDATFTVDRLVVAGK